jgi:hypothetical protein
MGFQKVPHLTGAGTVSMTALTASDDAGGIEYYFECTTDNSHSSGWQRSPVYSDSNLAVGKKYCYRVAARDANGNESKISQESCVLIKERDIYVEADGKCVMEAENAFVSNNGDKDPNNGRMIWFADSAESGYSGSGYMTTKNDVAWPAQWWNKACGLSWKVNINNAGEYYLAARKLSLSDGDDSAYMGVDGEKRGGNEFTTIETEFTWQHGSVSLGYLDVGTHTIMIRRREDGFMLDRVMIAKNESDLPQIGSTEIGEPESVRTDTTITAVENQKKNRFTATIYYK